MSIIKQLPIKPARFVSAEKTNQENKSRWPLILFIGVVFFIPIFVYATFHPNEYCGMENVLLFYPFQIFAILPHELAHAVTGRFLGLSVNEVSVGRGRKLFTLPLLGFDVKFRAIPFVGVVYFSHKPSQSLRWRYFLSVLAGPLTHCVFALIALLFLRWDFDLINSVQIGQVFVVSQIYQFLTNMFPFKFLTSAGTTSSDGYHLIQLLFSKYPEIIYPKTKNLINVKDGLAQPTSNSTRTG